MEEGKKRCWDCGLEKPLEEFGRDRARGDGLKGRCRECERLYLREWNKEKPHVWKPKHAAWDREHNQIWWEYVIDLYGGVCAHCGYTERDVMELDHINGRGPTRERRRAMIARIYRAQARDPNLQLLCANCHRSKTRHGECRLPHEAPFP